MSKNYSTESQIFRNIFDSIKHKKIVLYGIGRYTVTLLPDITDYNIIGFLDRDTENIGNKICGIPVLSLEEAVEYAELIIINTVEAYWKTIFSRIQNIKTPIYYKNGEKAIVEMNDIGSLAYWNSSLEQLRKLTQDYNYISFDFFDTLFMRKVYLPKDIFTMMEKRLSKEWKEDINFKVLRECSVAKTQMENISLDDIYETMAKLTLWSRERIEYAKALELQLETNLLVPRTEIINLCCDLVALGKKVYIISDMYLPLKWFHESLKKVNINCPMDAIWISCEKKADKLSGSMWELYQNEVLRGSRALHIGDNQISDVNMAKKYAIDSFYLMSARDMLSVSGIHKIERSVYSQMSANILGLIIQKIFNNPFVLNDNKGTLKIDNPVVLGYSIFGPIIQMFLIWLHQSVKQDNIKKLFFLARDGYFLKVNYEFFIHDVLAMENGIPQIDYLLISRRVIMAASIYDIEDFKDFLRFPFCGSFKEYMKVRFNYELPLELENINSCFITLPQDEKVVLDLMKPYMGKVWEHIKYERQEYLKYLNDYHMDSDSAVVDTWYYGNTQFYLNKLINNNLKGYYFAANLSDDNKCSQYCMSPCFQARDDLKAERCQIFKKALITESFLTAPYGMIKEVKGDGTFLTCDLKENQKNFVVKEKINQGVKEFIKDFGELYSSGELLESRSETSFVDSLFSYWFDGGCELSEELKKSFWSDNEMVQAREFKIFD